MTQKSCFLISIPEIPRKRSRLRNADPFLSFFFQLTESLKLSDDLNKIDLSSTTPTEGTCEVSGYGDILNLPGSTSGLASSMEVVIKEQDTCGAIAGQICAGISGEGDITLCTVRKHNNTLYKQITK